MQKRTQKICQCWFRFYKHSLFCLIPILFRFHVLIWSLLKGLRNERKNLSMLILVLQTFFVRHSYLLLICFRCHVLIFSLLKWNTWIWCSIHIWQKKLLSNSSPVQIRPWSSVCTNQFFFWNLCFKLTSHLNLSILWTSIRSDHIMLSYS